MRIRNVRIENYRCLREVDLRFDEVTTFIGPNGAGKSSVLRALDWYFNSTKGSDLSNDDVYRADESLSIKVEVEFEDLTDSDRIKLGRYAPGIGQTLRIRKEWTDGTQKIIGRSRAFPDFMEVRKGKNATDRRRIYNDLREGRPELGLPSCASDADVVKALEDWELANETELVYVDIEESNHFFGFNGHGVMSGLFDFVFVSADIRAVEEATDSRAAILGRIVEMSLDRATADTELDELFGAYSQKREVILGNLFNEKLKELSKNLTCEVERFSNGREVSVGVALPSIAAPKTQFEVGILDEGLATTVDRQGHGFQRALVISALKWLAETGRVDGGAGTLFLAIEEPELYQHPGQARVFAAVLRQLAEDAARGIQVAYATHSPYFLEARSFHQLRRVTRVESGDSMPETSIQQSSSDDIIGRLEMCLARDRILKQIDNIYLGRLGEAFFAGSVLLVEGATERAVLSGVASRSGLPVPKEGIFIGESGGKQGILLPYAVLSELGVPTYVLVDNDSHLRDRLAAATQSEAGSGHEADAELQRSVSHAIEWNRKILRFFGQEEEDWPIGPKGDVLRFVDGGLEQALETMWPAWEATRLELVKSGLGFDGKNSATYEQAACAADGDVPAPILDILRSASKLAA